MAEVASKTQAGLFIALLDFTLHVVLVQGVLEINHTRGGTLFKTLHCNIRQTAVTHPKQKIIGIV